MVFCDWLSIYQVHLGGVPLVNEGHVFSVNADGEVEWEVTNKMVFKGSHDTSIRIRSDGYRVTLEGNIGRFNRRDNLFGYTVAECIEIANMVVEGFGLPPFTDLAPMPLASPKSSAVGKDKVIANISFSAAGNYGREMNADRKDYFSKSTDSGFQAVGAVITRVDLTKNWETGSPGNCSQFIRHLQGFKSRQFEPLSYKTTGVSWGEGSKFWYAKVYDKAAEYVRQIGKGSKKFDPQLLDYMLMSGIARHEISLKSRYLKQSNLWRTTQWGEGMEDRIYALFSDVVEGAGHVDQFLEIPGRAGELAVAWRDGADLKKRLSQATYYRYRKQLLTFGIDIAVPSKVSHIRAKVEVITLSPASPPHWYHLPKVA